VAEEPEQVLPQERIPALSAMKNGQSKARSISSSSVPRMIAGKLAAPLPVPRTL
jgi:hypothetical protein